MILLKRLVFIKDIKRFSLFFNNIYSSFFTSGKYPARSCVEVSRLPKDVLIEIEAIAYKKIGNMIMNKWGKLCFLILGGGTIFKLSSMKDVFYVPMQQDWGLSNTQIGFGFTIYAIIQTIGLFSSLYIADRFSKKILLPAGLIGVGLCGAYLSTLPPLRVI